MSNQDRLALALRVLCHVLGGFGEFKAAVLNARLRDGRNTGLITAFMAYARSRCLTQTSMSMHMAAAWSMAAQAQQHTRSAALVLLFMNWQAYM